jgi:hypothetical protein
MHVIFFLQMIKSTQWIYLYVSDVSIALKSETVGSRRPSSSLWKPRLRGLEKCASSATVLFMQLQGCADIVDFPRSGVRLEW